MGLWVGMNCHDFLHRHCGNCIILYLFRLVFTNIFFFGGLYILTLNIIIDVPRLRLSVLLTVFVQVCTRLLSPFPEIFTNYASNKCLQPGPIWAREMEKPVWQILQQNQNLGLRKMFCPKYTSWNLCGSRLLICAMHSFVHFFQY